MPRLTRRSRRAAREDAEKDDAREAEAEAEREGDAEGSSSDDGGGDDEKRDGGEDGEEGGEEEEEEEEAEPTPKAPTATRAKARRTSLEALRQGKTLRATLQTWRDELAGREQLDDGEDTTALDHMSAQLLRPLVMRCKDNVVVLLAGCCLADILHIYAPEPPYSSSEIKTVFDFLVDRLRGLQQKPGTPSYKLSFYILQKLALCRSSCILVELPDAPDDACTSEDLIVALVEAMFDIMVPAREHEVEAHALELLVGLFDEMERFTPRILDALLVRLLPDYQKDAPKAFELAVKVIRQLADRLREPLSALLNGLVSGVHESGAARRTGRARKRARRSSGAEDDESGAEGSEDSEADEDDDGDDGGLALVGGRHAEEEAVATEVKDNVYEIIFQLFRIDASLLLYTLPHVATQLEASDEESRRQAVDLVGRIFCEVDRPSLLADNARLWAAFLRRILDIDSGIRLSLVSFAGFALNREAPMPPSVTSKMGNRGGDSGDEDGDGPDGAREDEDDDGDVDTTRQRRGNVGDVGRSGAGGANFWVKHFIAPNFHAQYAKTLDAGTQRSETQEPSFLELALNDKDVNVRREAVEVVVAFVSRPGVVRQFKRFGVGDALVRALAVRLCDKRVDLATSALEGLAKCFNAGIVEPYWAPEAEAEADDTLESPSGAGGAAEADSEDADMAPTQSEVQTFAQETLEWIPNEIFVHALHSQRTHDESLLYRHALCTMVDSVLLGKRRHRGLQARTTILVRVWAELDEVARNAFGLVLLKQRSRLAGLLTQVVTLRESTASAKPTKRGSRRSLGAANAGDSDGSRQDAARSAKALQALNQIAQEFVPAVRCPNASGLLEAIWEIKDNHVFRDLKAIATFRGADPDEVAHAETDLVQRLGSKSETARAVRVLLVRLMPTAFGELELAEMLGARARRVVAKGTDRDVEDLCALVEMVASDFAVSVSVKTVESGAWIFALAKERFCSAKSGKQDNDGHEGDAESDEDEEGRKQHAPRSRSRRSGPSAKQASPPSPAALAGRAAPSEAGLENLCVTACNVASVAAAKDSALPGDGEVLEDIFMKSRRVDCVKAAAKAWATNLLRDAAGAAAATARERFENILARALKQAQSALRSISKMDVARAQCALAGLKALLKHCPDWSTGSAGAAGGKLKAVLDRTFEFVRRPLADGSAEARDEVAKAKVLGIKVICYEVLRRVREFDPDDLVALRRLVLILRKFVADSGDPWTREAARKVKGAEADASVWPPSEEEASMRLRLYAGKALIKLEARCPGGPAREVLREAQQAQQAHQREIQRWVELSWLALDPVEDAREAFVATLYKEFIMRGRELFRYGAFFPLAAALRPKGAAHGHLTQLLRFLQRSFQTKTARAATMSGREGENLVDLSAQFAPENMISTLIYLVAHHPQMPRDRDQVQTFVSSHAGQRVLVKPLVVLFDALSSVAPQHNTNAGLLYALLEVMRRHTDALDPGCDNIHMIGEISQMLIKLRMKVSPDSLEYPGGVVLPKMYVAVQSAPLQQRSTNAIASPGLSPVTPQHSSKDTERSARRRREQQQLLQQQRSTAVLPANFELRVGGGGAGVVAAADDSLTPRRKRVRPAGPSKPAAAKPASVVTPTRKQPSRSTKAAVSGYADPDDLMLE